MTDRTAMEYTQSKPTPPSTGRAGRGCVVIDEIYERRQRMRAEGWRFCHNRSARKHRKQGHEVRYFAYGEYAWRRP